MLSGSLILIPVSIGADKPSSTLPDDMLNTARALQYFVVENAKTARAELKRIGTIHSIQSLNIREFPHNPSQADLEDLLSPTNRGYSIGVMSEAGVPCVADPGALLVRAAHLKNIKVVPLVGPSSLLLALMASGLNGQSFAFNGYLPIQEPERSRKIHALEEESKVQNRTQIFIETPYRNSALFTALLRACRSDTRLCVASGITTPEECILSKPIDAWRSTPCPAIDKKPTIFLIQAS